MNVRPWFRVGRRAARPELALADECEAYLEGRAAALLRARGETIPAWAHLNQLARGSLDQIRSLAAVDGSTATRRSRANGWDGAIALLAEQLLADVHDDTELRAVQRSALWPLEADLLAGRDRVDLSSSELFVVALGCIVDATARPA